MEPHRVDLNADLGESFGRWRLGDDEALLGIVTSANVACGFHAGDPATLVATCRAGAARGVTIGAQVSYRDLAGFGRRFIDVSPDDLYADVLYQLGALDGIARAAGSSAAYVKPHGALYNAVVTHREQAQSVAAAVADHPSRLPVLCLPGSALAIAASAAGLRAVPEVFADRAYGADGTLVDRRTPGAVLSEPTVIHDRVRRLVADGTLETLDGTVIAVEFDSICVHGDSPGAVALARATRAAIEEAGASVAAFANR